ncbi:MULTISPECIES: permease [unclassified Fusibacter]|uniref:permease n=1 Tax=unclassified Fusibacter TaxID=2624464 RepID=UPI0013E962A8|nr:MULTISPECIES: permease [unclassified Fusibacter]MCK8059676.1 permease [Fusibacter sp. A2]NPE21477.1 hypothetical protein [Fusibacter sp. A1]
MDFNFFIQEMILLPVLILGMATLTTTIRLSLKPHVLVDLLSKTKGVKGYALGSLIGAITPFCSCSSVPIFLGISQMALKPGLSFSFLITSPLVHEVAFVMVWQLFGWKLALFYLTFSLLLGILGGFLMEKTGIGYELITDKAMKDIANPYIENFKERVGYAFKDSLRLLKKILPMLVVGILIGSVLHNRDLGFMSALLENSTSSSQVLLAVLVGIPLYSGIAVGVPIAAGLIGSGLGLGTGIAFILSVAGLSLPEMIMLKGVMSTRLLVGFVLYIAMGMIVAGTVLNYMQPLFF